MPAVPMALKKAEPKKVVNPLFVKRPKNFGIGQDTQLKRNFPRFVIWPKCTRLQRQRAFLYKRLKVPLPVSPFTQALDQQTATQLFRLMDKALSRVSSESRSVLTYYSL